MTVSWLQPPRALRWRATDERRRARVHDDALAVVDERRAGRADPRLLVRLEPLADVERELGPAPVDGDRAAVGPDQPALGLEDDEVLADGDRGDAEPGRQVADPGAPVLLDDAGDVLLALAGEDVARARRWLGRSRRLHLARSRGTTGFRSVPTHSRPARERNVKKVIEINRNLWQAIGTVGRPLRTLEPSSDVLATRPGRRTLGRHLLRRRRRAAGRVGYHQPRARTIEPTRARTDRRTGDGGRRDAASSAIRRGAASPADRAAVVGLRQLRDPVQGLRPEGRPARPVREGRRRGPGPPVHRRRADRRAAHPVGQGRRLRRPRPPRRATAASRLGHDQLERLPGRRLHARQRLPPGRARPAQGARPPARVHRHHGRDRLARPQAVVLRRHELPGPGRHPRPPGPAGRGARGGLRPARRRTSGCCSSTSSSSRRSTRWTCPDWGTAYVHCLAARARRPRSSSTPATTRRAPTSSSSSRRCCGPDRLGGVRLQLALLRRRRPDGRRGRPVPAVPDHARGRAGGRASRPRPASRSCSTSATTSSRRSPARSAR